MATQGNNSNSDDDFDVDVDLRDDDDRDDNGDDEQTPSPEEFARMQRALTKANREAKKNRLRLKEFLNTSNDGKDGDDKNKRVERERIRDEVSEVEETRWKKRVVRQAAKASLLEAGLTGDASRLARLVDEDDVDVDDDGEITDGLEEQIEQIKEDYPDLFEDRTERKKERRSLRGIDGSDRGNGRPPRKLSSAERIQQQVLKTGRR